MVDRQSVQIGSSSNFKAEEAKKYTVCISCDAVPLQYRAFSQCCELFTLVMLSVGNCHLCFGFCKKFTLIHLKCHIFTNCAGYFSCILFNSYNDSPSFFSFFRKIASSNFICSMVRVHSVQHTANNNIVFRWQIGALAVHTSSGPTFTQ